MKKISKLTPEQEADLIGFREECLARYNSCEPADRSTAERAFVALCREVGREPAPVIWADSPLSTSVVSLLLDRDASLHDSFRASLRASLNASLLASVRASLLASLRDSLNASLRAGVHASLRASVHDSLNASLHDSLNASLNAGVHASLHASLNASLNAGVRASLHDSFRASLRASLHNSLLASLRASLHDSFYSFTWSSFPSNSDLYWLLFYGFCTKIGVRLAPETSRRLDILDDLTRSCGWWAPYRGFIIACDRPRVVRTNAESLLHDETGPALAFRDGWSIHAIHGVRVPAHVVEAPETITKAEIDAEDNAEVRRVMVERYGVGRYAADSGAKVIDRAGPDHPVAGLRNARLLRWRSEGYERPLTIVECVNSTPEPDGTHRLYHLSVDPGAYAGRAGKDVLAAMASTWRHPHGGGLVFERPEDYCPEIET